MLVELNKHDNIQNVIKDMYYKIINFEYILSKLDYSNEISNIILLRNLTSINMVLGSIIKGNLIEDKKKILDEYKKNYLIINKFYSQGFEGISTFYGLAGVCLTSDNLLGYDEKIDTLIYRMREILIKNIHEYLENISKERKMENYEAINGLCGVVRVLLNYLDMEGAYSAVEKALSELILFVNYKKYHKGVELPSWYISNNEIRKEDRDHYKNGYINLGVSHGVGGVLSILSIATLNGVEVKGQKDAIELILEYLYRYRINYNNKIYWPGRVSFEEYIENKKEFRYERPSWCYGTAGTARVIFLAGKALSSEKYIYDAQLAIKAMIDSDLDKMGFTSPTFCHGYSGILHIVNLMYEDTKDDEYIEIVNRVIEKVMSYYDKNNSFGFTEIDNNGIKQEISSIHFVEGANSILLPLLAVLGEKSNWDSIFLIN